MKVSHWRQLPPLTVLLLVAHVTSAAEPVDYLHDVKPILSAHCYACHGALKQESGLRLDTAALARKGGESGPAVTPHSAEESLVIAKVTAADIDERMPPEGKGAPLSAAEVTLLRRWIDAGARAPAEAPPPDPRTHWAFQRPVRPPIPRLHAGISVSNPVDAFLDADLNRLGLIPAPLAPPTVLLRRVYLDLVGFPPTPQECEAFLEDPSPAAYEQVVDRLLASPEYGQRWGRHWMDVWRYSDWVGFRQEVRGSQRHIWHWRDWIVNSLNADKGYDRMVTEMLAGDEVAPEDPGALAATGFLARNYYHFNRNVWLDDTVEHTAKAFLGLTLNCARCHDHKFDPISQQAYYQFRAIFEPHQISMDPIAGVPDLMSDGLPRVYDAEAAAPTYLLVRGEEKSPDTAHPLAPGVPAVLGGRLVIEPVSLPSGAWYPALKPPFEADAIGAAREAIDSAGRELARARSARAAADEKSRSAAEVAVERADLMHAQAAADLESLTARWAADKARVNGASAESLAELSQRAAHAEGESKVLAAVRAVFDKEQTLVECRAKLVENPQTTDAGEVKAQRELAEALKTLDAAGTAAEKSDGKYTPAFKQYPHTSTGRRLALARWIVSRDNPLTARVAVNHIWLRHFGAPLVDNVEDFGLRSPKPRQAALLDYLAVELMDSGWSMKHLHRLLVTSEAYRRDSVGALPTASISLDPDNHYFWRMNRRRLEAEAVRDSVLAVAGQLDLTLGGPDLDPQTWQTCRRRSLYFRDAAERQVKFLTLFDAPSVTECYRRSESIVPQQALAMLNSSLTLSNARLVARSLNQSAAKNADRNGAFVRAAFMRVLSREPTAEELQTCRAFLAEQTARLSDPRRLVPVGAGDAPQVVPATEPALRGRENLIHVLLNHNDFITVR